MKFNFSAVCFVVICLFSTGVSVGDSLQNEQTLLLGNESEPKDLDPHLVTGVPEGRILGSLFEGLVGKDSKTLEVAPAVAERWEISKDGKKYRFFIRETARWTNGEQVLAEDFVYSWKRLLEAKTAAEYGYLAYCIKGAKAFAEGKRDKTLVLGVSAKKSRVFEVELERVTPYFLSLISHWSFYPVHRVTVEKHGPQWTRPENFVSNGPFRLKEWKVNQVVSVVKNETYWGKAAVRLNQVNFYPITSSDTEEKLFRTGKLHFTASVPIERLSSWEKDTTGVFRKFPHLGVYYYWLNAFKPPLDKLLVRRALAYGIDREKLVKYITKGNQLPAQFFTPPGTGGYTPPAILPKDGSGVAQAKAWLKEAGYPDGKGFPSLELLYNTDEGNKKIAEGLQGMWKENLGITVKLVNQEWKVFLESQRMGNFQMARAGWTADYNDPTAFLELFLPSGGNNRVKWKNPQFTTAMEKAGAAKNSLDRFTFFTEAEKVLLEELPVIPLYIYVRHTLRSREVKGWYDNIEDWHPLHAVYLEK